MRKRPVPKKLGKKMKRIRLGLRLSQREMVRRLNYKDAPLRGSQISMYENGQREPPMTLVLAYARLIGQPMDVLVDDKMKLP